MPFAGQPIDQAGTVSSSAKASAVQLPASAVIIRAWFVLVHVQGFCNQRGAGGRIQEHPVRCHSRSGWPTAGHGVGAGGLALLSWSSGR